MKVLVAYDGSAPAQKAVEHAARHFPGAELVLLRVVEAAEGSIGASVVYFQESLKEAREETAADVSADVTDLLDPDTVEYRIETVVGDPARVIGRPRRRARCRPSRRQPRSRRCLPCIARERR